MFIFGKFGAPAMGAAGAGVGAFASTWIGLFIVLFYASREQGKYRWFRLSNVNRSLIWDMVKLAAPAALATIVMMVGFGLFNSFSATLDGGRKLDGSCGAEEPLNGAATTNIVGIMKLIFTACLAFGAATATFVSQSLGAKRPDLASRFGWTSVRIGLVVFGVVGLFVGVLFPQQIISIMTHSEAVRAAMLMPLRMMGVATPLIAVALILSEALFGAGSTKFVAAAQLVLIFGILVPLSWFLSLKTRLGLTGMWMAAVAYSVCAAAVMAQKFRGDSWKAIKL
jgi:Na+-driven multidrug efflux pump